MDIEDIKEKVSKEEIKLDLKRKELREKKNEIEKNKIKLENLKKAIEYLQYIAGETQKQVSIYIEDIINLALDTCWPDRYKFKVEFVSKRGKSEAELYLLHNGIKVKPSEATGGGVMNMIAFALSIAFYSLGKSDNVLILDEPFQRLSKENQPRAGKILKNLSKKIGLQMLIITHNDGIIEVADKLYKVERESEQKPTKVIEK